MSSLCDLLMPVGLMPWPPPWRCTKSKVQRHHHLHKNLHSLFIYNPCIHSAISNLPTKSIHTHNTQHTSTHNTHAIHALYAQIQTVYCRLASLIDGTGVQEEEARGEGGARGGRGGGGKLR